MVVTAGETQEWEKSGAGKSLTGPAREKEVWVGRENPGSLEDRTWKAQGRQRKESRSGCFPGPTPPPIPDWQSGRPRPHHSRLRLHVTTSSGIAPICNPGLLQGL